MVRRKLGSKSASAANEPTKRVPAAAFPSWPTFEKSLTAALAKMAVDAHLVISVRRPADAVSDYYVQFAQGGRSGFLAEAVSKQFLKGRSALSPAQEEQMAHLGWQFPSPHDKNPTNLSREWPMPTPFDEVTALAIRTLREI